MQRSDEPTIECPEGCSLLDKEDKRKKAFGVAMVGTLMWFILGFILWGFLGAKYGGPEYFEGRSVGIFILFHLFLMSTVFFFMLFGIMYRRSKPEDPAECCCPTGVEA